MSLSIRAQAPRKSPRGPSSRKMEATQCTGPLYRGGGLPSCALGSVWFCSRTLTRSKGLKQQACRKGSVKGLGRALGWGVAYLNEREAVGREGSIPPRTSLLAAAAPVASSQSLAHKAGGGPGPPPCRQVPDNERHWTRPQVTVPNFPGMHIGQGWVLFPRVGVGF